MKNIKNNVSSILEDMRKITMLTGEISSVHQKSLMKWPYIVFDNVESVEINYDLSKSTFETQNQNLVEFHVFTSDQNIQDLDKKCETLNMWVKDMFWNETHTKVYINKSIVYPANKE